ncbi:MAG: TIR domain-containing protein [Actinomycetota bacterium]|nr:TIR domain-containing protein [Actinomycetota bacterium]
MTVFISHSFQNKPEFQNVADWLERDHVPYWRPSEIKAGASLREQLRVAVKSCSVCIFVATQRSVASSWCGAELGAFWGAHIPIVVYVAEASLPEEVLPPIVQGDVWERQLSLVAARAKELDNASKPGGAPAPTASVTTLTVEQLEKLVRGAFSLAEAQVADSAKTDAGFAEAAAAAAGRLARGAEATRLLADDGKWRREILWVDDQPANNRHERKALESFGIEFALAESTAEALDILSRRRFAAIISDMGRREGPQEGYRLLEALRRKDQSTPFFIYAGSAAPEHKRMAQERGAQGTTNVPNELVDMVLGVLERVPQRVRS